MKLRISLSSVFIFAAVVFLLFVRESQAWPEYTPQEYALLRNRMVKEELEEQGIKNPRVLQAFRDIPRHEFVASKYRQNAYLDMSIPIGDSQTISAPFVVAYMTEQLDPQSTDKVLEIGTGSGYQAAILSPLAKEVYSIEIVEHLGVTAKKTLERLKIKNVFTKVGDGYQGWAEHAPFDRIIVTCSPEQVPQPLVDQLKEGGRMIIPVGERYQQIIYQMQKKDGKLEKVILRPTVFVPMTGKAEDNRQVKPDPLHPKLVNSSFEELAGDSKEPVAWYYQRSMKVVNDEKAFDGKNFIRFNNDVAGRHSRIMQCVALDGREVRNIQVSIMMRGKNLVPQDKNKNTLPVVLINFFDENRDRVGENWLGRPQGTFDWKKESANFPVPARAREAIFMIGMFGATGEVDFDQPELKAVDPKDAKK